MTDDDWTTAAMSDGSLVADLLVHLRRASPPLTPPLTWQVRQRRSRPVVQKPTETASPSTPLSFSGATSASGAGDQVIDANENTASKRSRKKKTLAELKEDEALVLKERNDLKKKLDSLRVTVEIERASNDRLKRLKLDYISWSAKSENMEMVSSYSNLSADLRINGNKYGEQPCLSICPMPFEEMRENKFVLPDLNLPIEDHTI